MKKILCLLAVFLGLLFHPSFVKAREAVQRLRPPQTTKPWRVSVHFSPEILTLAPGEAYPVTVTLVNLSGRTIPQPSARILCPPGLRASPEGWAGRLPVWGAKFFPKFSSIEGLSPGVYPVKVEVFSGEKRLGESVYNIKVVIPPLELIPDPIKGAVQVWVGNPHPLRRLKGRVILSNPNRLLQDIVSSLLDLDPSQSTKVSIPLAGGMAPGIAYRFTARLETWEGFRKTFSRNLTFFAIPQASVPPSEEVSFKGWEEIPSLLISKPVSAPGVQGFGGPQDVAGSLRLQWDERYLYLFTVVKDNDWSPGDQVEIGLCLPSLSPRGSKLVHLILSSRNIGEISHIRRGDGREVVGSHLLVTRKADQTYYSARLPWFVLESFHPSPGQPLRLAVRLQDEDEGRIRGWLEWSGGLGKPTLDPSQFGDVMLGE